MVWRADGPQGFESTKVAFDLVHYFHGKCLDLGCGAKKIFPAKNIIGIDSGKDYALFGAVSNPDVVGSCEVLDYKDATQDCVFSSHLLEHVEDYKAALAEWWRVVRPGGTLILYLPHADWYPNIGMPGSNPDHKHDFRNADIEQAMKKIAWATGQGWDLEADEVRTADFEYSFLQVYRKREDNRTARSIAPRPEKSLGLVRLGAFGDALWITTVLPALKAQGWHITLYTQRQGEKSLRHDPNIDRMVVQPDEIFGTAGEAAMWQGAYWLHCERKHDLFINLVGSVERHLLPHPSDPNFYLPAEQRRRLMNDNYTEAVAKWAGVEFDPKRVRVRFTPSRDEMVWAAERRAQCAGPFVVINPSGSSLPKFWPHVQACMDLLAAAGVGGIVVGDLRGQTYTAPKGWEVVGTTWDLRQVYTIAAMADVVIGTESAIVNSVSHEPPLKIVLLSHSTANNLTRDWTRTVALEPEGLACYPCHRIHSDWNHCNRVAETNSAACQHAATAEVVAGYALEWIRGEMKEAA
jgi:ADP-heptose:LPS heptosyltransferase/SAM-dependent methyltransferase